jgi:hypothetical protein
MTELIFPTDPEVGDSYTFGSKTWIWTGFAWALQPASTANLNSLTTVVATITSTETSTSTNTGALTVVGGVGIGGDLYVGGNLTVDGVINATISGASSSTNNLIGGVDGQIPYQITTSTTGFFGPGDAGDVIISTGGGSPEFISTANLYVGYSSNVENILGGNTGSIVYQVEPGVTSFIQVGDQGGLLQSNGSSATFVSTATVHVGSADTATNITGGTAGDLVYQVAAGETGFIEIGSAGDLLASNGSSATFISTTTLRVGTADTATNVGGGAAGDLVYQVAPGETGFIEIGSAGDLLASDGSSATFVSTSTLHVGTADTARFLDAVATTATNVEGGNAGELVYQVSTGETGFVTTGTVGELLVSNGESSPQWQNYLFLSSTTSSTSTQTGALVVSGGVGIGGDLWVEGFLYVNGTAVITTSTINNLLQAGDDIDIEDLGSGQQLISNTSTLQSVTLRGPTTDQIVTFNNDTESTSTTTGAVIIEGGLGVGKRINCESIKIADTVFDSTESSINTSDTVVIDTYSIGEFRAAKYLVQVEEDTGSEANFQVTEILVLASNTGTVHLTEYGSLSTNGVMGTFNADVSIDNRVRLYFNPSQASNKTIYVLRTGMEAHQG